MKNNIIRTMLAVVFFLLFSLFGFKNVMAKGSKFAISPMNQRISLIPGEVYRGAITVGVPFDAEDEFDYVVSVAPYSLGEKEINDTNLGGSDFETMNSFNQMANWITIDNPKGTIQPNEQRTVSFSIRVPDDVPAGGQYAALLVKGDTNTDADDDTVAIKEIIQMAHILYAEIIGDTRKEAEIQENSIPSLLLNNELRVSSTIKNNGNVHTSAKYTLQVWPLFSDEELYTNEEKPEEILVLPDVTKYHSQEYNLPLIGLFRVRQTVEIFGEKSIAEKTIIVCPLWLLFIVVFVTTLIVIWLFSKNKNRKKIQSNA